MTVMQESYETIYWNKIVAVIDVIAVFAVFRF